MASPQATRDDLADWVIPYWDWILSQIASNPSLLKRQLHLHRAGAVCCQVESSDCLVQWQHLGEKGRHVDRAGAEEIHGPGEFLVEAERAAQADFFRYQHIDRQSHLTAAEA